MSALGNIAARVKTDVGRAPTAWLYLVIALTWGLAMALITPPFQVPDEDAHYYRAWSVAQLELVAEPGWLVTLPDNVATLPERLGSAVVDWNTNHYSVRAARDMLWEPIAPTSRGQPTAAATYGPIGYIPQAIGINVARVLGHSPLLALYFGRFLNLCASAMIAFFAIRMVPFGKPLMALVALLPMVVFEAASLSPDALALSGCLLFLAIALRLSTRPFLPTADLVLMTCTATVMLNIKPGFVVLVLLIFMLRPRQFGSVRRRYAVWVISTLAAAVGLSALLMLVPPQALHGYLSSLGINGVDQSGQLAFVLQHPWAFTKVLYRTFDLMLLILAQEGYGVLGWLNVGLPVVGMCGMVLAAILFMGYQETVRTTHWQRLVMCATGVVLACVVSLALYTASAVAAPAVSDLQGRYFIPVLALGLFAIYGIRPRRERAILLILVAAVGVAAVTTIATLLRFYY